jgi:hypothetical protein
MWHRQADALIGMHTMEPRRYIPLLVENGADVRVATRNPCTKDQIGWSAPHMLAHAGHNVDITLAAELVA